MKGLSELVFPEQSTLPETVKSYVTSSRADSTRRAYRTDWRIFTDWCNAEGVSYLPASAEVVASFLVSQAGYKPATLSRRLAAIAAAHQLANQPSPTNTALVSATLSGIKRTCGSTQRRVRPVLLEDLQALVASIQENLTGLRDRALLLIGWAGAFRRSELAALSVEDIEDAPGGLVLTIRRSKTDQEGEGQEVGIPYGTGPVCPVAALYAWLSASGITTGPIFRRIDQWGNIGEKGVHPGTVADIVKKRVAALGLDSELFAGHSLRAGLATSAAQQGATELAIMRQTRHTSSASLRRYIRRGDVFRTNAATIAGL